MNIVRKLYFIVSLILLTAVSGYSKDEFYYYKHIYIDSKGFIQTQDQYQRHFGHFLYTIGNQDVYRVKFRDNRVIEYYKQMRSYYIVHNDDGRVRELNEGRLVRKRATVNKGGKFFPNAPVIVNYREVSHIYRYDKEGYVIKIDHFNLSEDSQKYRYFPIGKTDMSYDSNKNVIKEEAYDKNDKLISKSLYQYNNANKIISKQFFKNNKLTAQYFYEYNQNNQPVLRKDYYNSKLISLIHYNYDKNGNLTSIDPKIFKTPYYKTNDKNQFGSINFTEGITQRGVQFNPQGQIINRNGILPSIQSYISYNLKLIPSNISGVSFIIDTSFINYSAKDHTRLNSVKLWLTPRGQELKVEWFNQKGEELYHKIPKQIRTTQPLKVINLLNIKHLILGQVLTKNASKKVLKKNKEIPITREIIVEIYDKKEQREWCYFGAGYYFYLIQFSDKAKEYNKIHILKAGFQYETIHFVMDKNKTIINLNPTYLKQVNIVN